MNGRPTYLPDALGRIEGLGEKAIAAFFNEIPRELLKVVTRLLPPLPGFRPGTNAAVQRQLQSLAQKIATHRTPRSFARSPEETALYGLWRTWSQSQLAETAVVRELLDSLDEDEDDESTTPNQSERMAVALKALVASGTCARETLEQFVTFSPFQSIEGFLMLARGARTNAEIKRDSALLDLPDRLHKDEARLQLVETKLDASERSATLIRSELDELRGALSELRTRATADNVAVAELTLTAAAANENQKTLEEVVARLSQATDRVTGRVDGSEKQGAAIAEGQGSLKGDISRVTDDLSHLSKQVATYDGRLNQMLADVLAGATELKSQNERFSRFDELVRRIDQLESMLLERDETKHRKDESSGEMAVRFEESTLLIERLSIESGLSVKPLHSVAEVLSSLDSALVEAGLKKSTATFFSEEILAAVASEQIVFFRGGLAVDVARKCALSLSGTSVFRIAVPLGLTDPSLFRRRLSNRSNSVTTSLSSIVVEGVNNSPLDLLREVLLDQVTYRVGGYGRRSPTAIFASLADGAGAFPLESSYLELGPVFDLEQMDWRQLRRERLPVLGSIAHDDWQSIAMVCDGKATDYEEALQGARQLAHKRSMRFEANVLRAFSALKVVRRDQGLTALQSVTFGWLAPYWQALSAKADDIDAQIDGGKCDGTVADERLRRSLDEYRSLAMGTPT